MKALLFAAAALLLVGPALATLGDNGMTTYTGRKRANNTLIFGNELVINQAVDYAAKLAAQGLTGTWQPFKNDAAVEKKEVRPLRACAPSATLEPSRIARANGSRAAAVVQWQNHSQCSFYEL